jgi:hypothetical protein
MSVRVRETGRMFTRARLAVIAGVVLIALAGALLLFRNAPAANPVRSGVLGVSTSGPPAQSPQSTPAGNSSPSSTPAATPTTSGSTTTTTHSSGTTSGTPNCTTVARSATFQIGSRTYSQGDTVEATTTIVNNGPSCKLTNNTVTANYLFGNAVVHTQTVAVTSATTWSSGQTLAASFTWSLQTCSGAPPCSSPVPGAYTVTATWPGVSVMEQSFTLYSASTCTASDVEVGIANTVPTVASAGSSVVIDGTLTNNSGHTCAVAEATTLVIKDSGGNVVFANGMGASSNSQTWNNNQVLSFPYTWNTSAPGTYEITFTDNTSGISTPPLPITLK